MKLRCRIVSRKLNGLASSERLPESVVRHLEQCEECRREASAYTKLGNLLRECDVDEPGTELTWDKLRSALSKHPEKAHKHKVTLIPAYALTAVMIVAVLAASVYWINRRPDTYQIPVRNHQAAAKQREPAKQEQRAVTIVKKQEQHVSENKANSRIAAVPQPVPFTENRTEVKHKKGSMRHTVRQAPKLANTPEDEASPAAPTVVAKDNSPETSTEDIEIVIVDAEEHVIDIVGVGGEDTNGREYVIQQVRYNPDQIYTRL